MYSFNSLSITPQSDFFLLFIFYFLSFMSVCLLSKQTANNPYGQGSLYGVLCHTGEGMGHLKLVTVFGGNGA